MTTAAKTAQFRGLPLLSAKHLALGGAALVFVALCVPPLVYMLFVSMIADGALTFDAYRGLLFDSRQRELLLNSAVLGASTAFLATLLGAPIGLLVARVDLHAKHVLRIALLVPLILPPYILALSWVYVTGPTGILASLFGNDLLSAWTYSHPAAVVVLSINLFPLAMLAAEAAARRVDGRLEEAGLLNTGPVRVFTRITLPLIAPGVGAAALLIFVVAISEFGVPALLRVRVFTTEVFTAFAAHYDFARASALSVPLLIIALVAAVSIKRLIGERLLTTRRSIQAGLVFQLPRFRFASLAWIGFMFTVAVVLPLLALAAEARGTSSLVDAISSSAGAIRNSILLSTLGALLTVGLALLLGYARARTRSPVGSLADLFLVGVFAAPSTVLGVGLIGFWNQHGMLGSLYRSPLIIIVACLARFVPVSALILAAAVRQVPASLEEAAEVAGASWPRSFARIVLPQITAATAAALVVSFIFAFGEVGATVLVAPPGESTLPVLVYTLIANAPSSQVASLALIQAGVVLIPLVLFAWLARDGESITAHSKRRVL